MIEEYIKSNYRYLDGDILNVRTGKVMGTKVKRGSGLVYRILQFTIRGRKVKYYTHRAVWLLEVGSIDRDTVVDHIDGNGLNNKVGNLRVVSRSTNSRNAKIAKNNISGVTGVCYDKNTLTEKRWRAYIHVDGKRKYLGRFLTKEDAITARTVFEVPHGYISRKE